MKKRLLSILLVLTLACTLLAPAASADVQTVVLDICDGSITLTETGYQQGDGEAVSFSGSYQLMQSNLSPSVNTVTVKSGTQEITIISSMNIDVSTQSGACAFAIMPGAKVDLILEQDLTLVSGTNMAGLQIPTGAELTITATKDTGALTARGGEKAAGIGGSYLTGAKGCGNLTISSGVITVTGGAGGAGIGGNYQSAGTSDNGFILINGGIINATTRSEFAIGSGAGIGGGDYGDGTGENGRIEITGSATVTATGTYYNYTNGNDGGAAIGGGDGKSGTGRNGEILIHGNAIVHAYTYAASVETAAIGGGNNGHGTGVGGSIQIYDNATVTAVSYGLGAGIGGSRGSSGAGSSGQILIADNATVTASSKLGSAIGGGYDGASAVSSGKIVVGGASVTAVTNSGHNAAIGGETLEGALHISGDVVTAIGGIAGLGGSSDSTGTINITSGHTYATGTYGIGFASKANLMGGYIEATSTSTASGKTAIACPIATGGSNGPWVVCDGDVNDYTEFISGVLIINGVGKLYGNSTYTLKEDRTIEEGTTLTLAEGQKLAVPEDVTLTVNGTLIAEEGSQVLDSGTLVTGESGKVTGLVHNHKLEEVPAAPGTCSTPAP